MMKKPIFTGSSVAIITPFDSQGNIDYEEFGRFIEFQLENKIDSITVGATTGEGSTLSDEEHREIIRYCVEKVNHRVPVIAGTGSNDTGYALDLSLFACEVGADALLLVTPYYNKTTQAGLIKHYSYIADRVSKPVLAYNVPSRTGMHCTAETYFELSKHPNINGVKEASGDFSMIAKTRHLCGDDFYIWSGNDDQIVPLLSLGGQGVISVFANIAPRVSHDIVDFYVNGKVKESSDLQIRYIDLIENLFKEVNPIPVKTAVRLIGFNPGTFRMPLCEMGEKNFIAMQNAMKDVGLI